LDIREIDNLRLIYLANYWNRGKWSKDYGPEDDSWETNKGLKEKLDYEVVADGTFWMKFDDWLLNFNTLYYCRIFPDSWSQYCIPGNWTEITSGGAPPKTNLKPWIPERPNEEGKATTSFKVGSKSILNTNQTLNSKSSIFNHGSSSKEGLGSLAAKRLSKGTLKLNMLPAVDEGRDEESDPVNMNNVLSLLKNSKKMVTPVNPTRSSIAILPGTSNFSVNSRVSVLKPTASNTNVQKSLMSVTHMTEFKGTKTVNNQNKTAYHSKLEQNIKRVIINDTEDRWFLNPQYKVVIKPGTRLIISLMQGDDRISHKPYQKCNCIIVLTRSKYSRVWDLKEEYIIKKDELDDKVSREKLIELDYNEVLRKLTSKKRKKILAKTDRLYLNIIPYLDYHQKYEVEKMGNSRIFKPYYKEGEFWLRIFASDEIYLAEVAKPYEKLLEYEWTNLSAGGARYIKSSKGKVSENPHWPINPQYLLKFEHDISMKLILRKSFGRYGEEEKIGMILTKPDYDDNISQIFKNQKGNTIQIINKKDQIERVVESTKKILASKKIDYDDVTRKMTFNDSEWVVESSYSNNYCSSIFVNFNKIDSPIMLIPTLENDETIFNYKLFIYSNRPVELFSLNSDDSKVVIGEWKDFTAGGCHLASDDKIRANGEDYLKKRVDWYDNPKYLINFEAKDRIEEINFEIHLTRSQTIWKKKIANSIVNSMMGIYIFKYDKEKWKQNCINMDKVDFIPKSEIVYKFHDSKVDPKGYIIMPATYGPNVSGPFTLMVKCKNKFNLTPFEPK
jgi:hypothetical protein